MADVAMAHEALHQIDRALAGRPVRDAEALTAAMQSLTDFRDHILHDHRRDGGSRHRRSLDHLNAVISVVLAMEFPLGEAPWTSLEQARGWLAAML